MVEFIFYASTVLMITGVILCILEMISKKDWPIFIGWCIATISIAVLYLVLRLIYAIQGR